MIYIKKIKQEDFHDNGFLRKLSDQKIRLKSNETSICFKYFSPIMANLIKMLGEHLLQPVSDDEIFR